MRVLDASVVVAAVSSSSPLGTAARTLLGAETTLHAPDILLAEVTSALRGMTRRADISPAGALLALGRASALPIRPFPFAPFLARTWELRDNLTVHDAWYVALAESLGAVLVTDDARLRGAAGVRCPRQSAVDAAAEQT